MANARRVIIEVLDEAGGSNDPPQWVSAYNADCAMAMISPDKLDAMVFDADDVAGVGKAVGDDWAVGVKAHAAPRKRKANAS